MTGIKKRSKLTIRNEQGMALLVVLGMVSVLIALSIHLSGTTARFVRQAGKETDRLIAREMAFSGIHLAMAVLADDAGRTDQDSVQENWANPEKLDEMVAQLGFGKNRLKVSITDELGKIQLNSLIKQFPGAEPNPDQIRLWEDFFYMTPPLKSLNLAWDPAAMINAMIDWLDSGDDHAVTGLTGAESDYYLDLTPPNRAADSPFNHVMELFQVKGLAPLYATLIRYDKANQKLEEGSDEPGPLPPGDLFTVYGRDQASSDSSTLSFPGKININTAGHKVLSVLVGSESAARDLVDFRAQRSEDGKTFTNRLDKDWYTSFIDLSDNRKTRLDRMIQYTSNYFCITAQASVNTTRLCLKAYVERNRDKTSNQWQSRIIQMEKE